MNFYPAIDIKDGQFVRLKKGLLSKKTVYGDNPTNQAKKFVSMGAKWIHIVDLDGAFEGKCKNMDRIIEIKKTVNCRIQVGGGIRNIKTAEKLINNDIDRIVLGTVALKKPHLVKEMCKNFPKKIAVGVDAKKGFVATEGWAKNSKVTVVDMLRTYEDSGVSVIIFTDIEKDGLMKGLSFDQLINLLKNTNLNVIASGGVASLKDLKKIKKIQKTNLIGVIAGKAVYEKKFTVREAINILEK
jgi:phosphoribosylformimino-5-aminoimidazole carboxamide ribotide isomerase